MSCELRGSCAWLTDVKKQQLMFGEDKQQGVGTFFASVGFPERIFVCLQLNAYLTINTTVTCDFSLTHTYRLPLCAADAASPALPYAHNFQILFLIVYMQIFFVTLFSFLSKCYTVVVISQRLFQMLLQHNCGTTLHSRYLPYYVAQSLVRY